MKNTGRTSAILIILFVHTSYIIYYLFRDGVVDPVDLMGYPLLTGIAYWCGKQYDKAKYYSEKDILTSLYNRRFVLGMFEKITAYADRNENKFFVLILDCDNFKDINDSCGHHRGDEVLIKIAETLINLSSKRDIVARWGGDEFLLLGKFTNEAELQGLIDRLNGELNKLSRRMNLNIHAAVGSAVYPNDSRSLEELIKQADHMMYVEKESRKRQEDVECVEYTAPVSS